MSTFVRQHTLQYDCVQYSQEDDVTNIDEIIEIAGLANVTLGNTALFVNNYYVGNGYWVCYTTDGDFYGVLTDEQFNDEALGFEAVV